MIESHLAPLQKTTLLFEEAVAGMKARKEEILLPILPSGNHQKDSRTLN